MLCGKSITETWRDCMVKFLFFRIEVRAFAYKNDTLQFLTVFTEYFHCVKYHLILFNFLVWKFCCKAQFPHQEIRWNYGIYAVFAFMISNRPQYFKHDVKLYCHWRTWSWVKFWLAKHPKTQPWFSKFYAETRNKLSILH